LTGKSISYLPEPTHSHWPLGSGPGQMPSRQGPSQNVDWALPRRRWSPKIAFQSSRDDLAGDIKLQLDGEPIGGAAATLWSPEPRRRWHPAVVHLGYYTNASFRRLTDEIKQPEDAQSHPESDDVLGEANHGRRRAQLRGFRRTSAEGIGQIRLILIILAWFLRYGNYWKHDEAPELLLRARYSLHRRCTSSPELGFLGFAEK
jgi:hypothetical protein